MKLYKLKHNLNVKENFYKSLKNKQVKFPEINLKD